jgi:hypothetical protein
MVKEIVNNVETIKNNQDLIKYLLNYALANNKNEYINNESNLKEIGHHLKLICKIIKNAEDNLKRKFVEDGNNIFLLLEKLLTCGKMTNLQTREILDVIENLLPEQNFDLNQIIKRYKIEIINTPVLMEKFITVIEWEIFTDILKKKHLDEIQEIKSSIQKIVFKVVVHYFCAEEWRRSPIYKIAKPNNNNSNDTTLFQMFIILLLLFYFLFILFLFFFFFLLIEFFFFTGCYGYL